MRNLKRALSLVMAAAMLIGMMAVSASAADNYEDFTDKDEIVNTEAVATMVSLGVFNGKEDGSYFDPTGIVTRAEMAKIIAVSLNGGKDPVLGSGAATTQFTDTKGNWAEAYIAYCANLGIINGKGDGTFGPNEPVTGTAAAKMFLTALGYRSDIEGLTGAGWDLKTDTLANKVGLYDGLDAISPSSGLTRDNTAQLVYNGVQAQEVQYRNNYGEYSGVIYAQENGTMLSNRFGVVKVEGIVAANEVFGIDGNGATLPGKTMLDDCNSYSSNGTTHSYNGTYPIFVDNDLVGQRVVIYVKFNSTLSPNATNSTVMGSPIISDKTTVVETTAKLKNTDAVKDALKGTGVSYNAAADVAVYTAKGAADVTGYVKADGVTTAPGVRQRFIDNNGDGKVDLVIREIKDLSKVSVYNTKDEKLTLSGIGSIDFDDIIGYEDVEKDDYVLVIKYDDTYYIEKVETVEGTVASYNNANSKITVDGTAYAVSAAKDYTNDLDGEKLGDLSAMVDNDYALYLDAYGNVVSVKVVKEAIGNYAVITASTGTDTTGFASGKVKLTMADGTKGTYDVNLLASAKKWDATTKGQDSDGKKEVEMAKVLNGTLAGTLVTYNINDDDTVTIGKPSFFRSEDYGDDEGTVATLESSVATYTVGSTEVVVDNSTLFFIKNGNGSYSIVTGLKALPSKGVTPNGDISVIFDKSGSNNVVTALHVAVSGTYASSASYAYISDKYTKTIVGGEDVYTYPVVLADGSADSIQVKGDDTLVKGGIYAYSLDSSGYAIIDDTDDKRVSNVFVYEAGNGTVSLWNADNYDDDMGTFAIAKDAAIWNVEDTDSIYDTSLTKASVFSFVKNDDGEIKTAFVSEIRDSADEDSMAPMANVVAEDGSDKIIVTPKDGETVTITWEGQSATFKYEATSADDDTPVAQEFTATGIASGDEVIVSVAVKDLVTRTYTVTVA